MTNNILLHVCCAPDATIPWPVLVHEGNRVTGYFYSSNIHPFREFRKRADAVRELASNLGGSCIVDGYRPLEWLESVRSCLLSPEGGGRCRLCFAAQLEAAAIAAVQGGFDSLSTTLSISPHKDIAVIDRVGGDICRSAGLKWLFRVWRRGGGFTLSVKKSRELGLYRQSYCGCVMSIKQE